MREVSEIWLEYFKVSREYLDLKYLGAEASPVL